MKTVYLFILSTLSLVILFVFPKNTNAAFVNATNYPNTYSSNCGIMEVNLTATNWPGGTVNVSCAGWTPPPPTVPYCPGSSANLNPGDNTILDACDCCVSSGIRNCASGTSCLQAGTLPAGCSVTSGLVGSCTGNNSTIYPTVHIDCSAPLQPTVTCSGSPNPANSGGTVTWTAAALGGSGAYNSYSWSDDSLTFSVKNCSTDANCNKATNTYTVASSTTKTKYVKVTDSASQTSTTANCSVTVNAACTCSSTDNADHCSGTSYTNGCSASCTGTKTCSSGQTCSTATTPHSCTSTPICTLSTVSSATVASTQCPAGQTGRDVTATISTSNITNSTITGVNWTMNTGHPTNSCTGTGCLTKSFPCVGYGSGQSLVSEVQFPGGPVSCSTYFDNPASGTPGNPGGPGTSSGSFNNFRYDFECANEGSDIYNDSKFSVRTFWGWSSGDRPDHFKVWVRDGANNAWTCARGDKLDVDGPASECQIQEELPGTSGSGPTHGLDIYSSGNTGINYYVELRAYNSNGSRVLADNNTMAAADTPWFNATVGVPICPFDLVVDNSDVKVKSGIDTSSIRTGDQMGFEGTVHERGRGMNAPSTNTRLSVFRQTSSGLSWIWDYDQATESISHNQSRTPSWSNITGLTSIPGNYLFRICANSNNAAPYEYRYDNNCGQGTYTVLPPPVDLDPGNITISPTTISPGMNVTFKVDVSNTGTGDAGSFNNRFCVNTFSYDTSCSSTTPTGRIGALDQPIASLSGNGGTYLNFTSPSWTSSIPGNYYVHFCADVGNAIIETSETNNCSSKTFTVIAPWAPWIQVDGDVHSNTKINLSGGPP